MVQKCVRNLICAIYTCDLRTEDPAASRELLSVLELDTCFKYLEIFPSRKFAHFEKCVMLLSQAVFTP